MNRTTLSYAKQYLAQGLSLVRVACDGTKQPVGKWGTYLRERPPTDAEIVEWFGNGSQYGIGIVPGSVSGGLCIIDVDSPPIVEAFEKQIQDQLAGILDQLIVVASPRDGGGRHYYYRHAGPAIGKQILAADASGKTLIEVPIQAIAPGSPPAVHPSGRPYKRISKVAFKDLATISQQDHDRLLAICRSFDQRPAADPSPRSESNYQGPARPGDLFNQLVNWSEILTPRGWTLCREDEATGELFWTRPGKDIAAGHSAISGINPETGKDLLRIFSSAAEVAPLPRPSGEPCASIDKFGAYAALYWKGDKGRAALEIVERFPQVAAALNQSPRIEPTEATPSKILPRLPFPIEAIPEPFQSYSCAAGSVVGCDPAAVAMTLMTAAAGVLGNSRVVQPKLGYIERSALWFALIADPGSRKTAIHDECMIGLRRINESLCAANADESSREDEERMRYDVQVQAWKSKQKTKPSDDPPPTRPDPPVQQRLLISDITIEKVAVILQDNPRGLLLARDELSAWLRGFGRYSNSGGPEISQWLELHCGGNLIVDRKTGDLRTIMVRNGLVSVSGSIQPKVFAEAMNQSLVECGFLARFLPMWLPKLAHRRWLDHRQHEMTTESRTAVEDTFNRLWTLPCPDISSPPALTFSGDAHDAFAPFYDQMLDEVDSDSGKLAYAFSKLHGACARLALIIDMVEWSHRSQQSQEWRPDNDPPVEISGATMQKAVQIADWFRTEIERVYSLMEGGLLLLEQQRLLDWIYHRGGEVSIREVSRGLRQYRDTQCAEIALQQLVKAGMGTWIEDPKRPTGGWPVRKFSAVVTGDTCSIFSRNFEQVSPCPIRGKKPQGDTCPENVGNFEQVSPVASPENVNGEDPNAFDL